jgi:hypothetical protein
VLGNPTTVAKHALSTLDARFVRRGAPAGNARKTANLPIMTDRKLVHLLTALTVGAAVLVTGAPSAAADDLATQRSTRAASLDRGHFAIGARDALQADGTLNWMPQTGVPFDSVYQYVSGSPGTPHDFKPSVIVAFARRAQLDGHVPVVSWFKVDGDGYGPQSLPARCLEQCLNGDTPKRNLDHLGDPAFMSYYYATFVAALQALNTSYNGPLILHVEPDLSGYGEMLTNDRTRCGSACIPTVMGETPTAVVAAVGLSGQTDLQSYPNTMQGFYLGLLHLRDLYAPRVSLAYHVSDWATANEFRKDGSAQQIDNDINQGTVPVDTVGLAHRVASFAAQNGASSVPGLSYPVTGVSRYDLVFNDVADHDAGYSDRLTQSGHLWWDTENVDLPNFSRWESYVKTITDQTQLPGMAWQIPAGNTVFLTENNTFGHYQDNRTQYVFDHIGELAAAGLVGVIFGGGNNDSSHSYDLQNDAPVNGPPTCTTRGSHSHTQVCTSRTSTVRDDDGGYLRERAAAYFASPYPLP